MMTEVFDAVEKLPPGMYFASSLTDGYGALLAMVVEKKATFLGEHMKPEGEKLVAVQVGKGRNPPPERTIGISRAFFTTVLKDYEDWKLKWWREAIQNSVDAGATKIDCLVFYHEDGTVSVSVTDNGGGMDEDILIDKFLMLGGSTKTLGSGAAGGFGKAKELLILPWLSWRIHTRDNLIKGEGLSYTLEKTRYLDGTQIEVTMASDQYTYQAPAITFIERCYLPNIKFTVTHVQDGETVKASPKADLRSETLIDGVAGKVEIYTAPVDYTGHRLYVRVNGLYMFDKWMSETGDKQVIAEIVAPSIEILTANRDGFRDYEVRSAVDKVVERVAKDSLSGLRSKQGLIRKKYQGSGKFQAEQREADALSEMGRVEFTDNGVTHLTDDGIERIVRLMRDASSMRPSLPDAELTRELITSVTLHGAHHAEEVVKLLVWEPDFYIINDVEGFKVPSKFMPETMKPQVVKLIRTWTEMCRFVLMQLGNFRPFGVGFIFGDYAHAAYLEDEDNERWLMLNPYVAPSDRRATWKPTNQDDLKKLYAFAIHECTHLADGLDYHDESFASALTANIAKAADGFRKLRKIANAIKMTDAPSVDVRAKRPTKKTPSVNQLKNKLLR